MPFILSEEQEAIQKTARDFATAKLPISLVRKLREGDPAGYAVGGWKGAAELGLTSIAIPEQYGGSGLGFLELGLVLEECGRTLAPLPFMSTTVLGTHALLLSGSESQKRDILPRVASGDHIFAFAHEELRRHAPYHVATRLEQTSRGMRLTGEKLFVLDGHIADSIFVVARASGNVDERGGLAIVLLPSNAAGMTRIRTTMVDGRNAARIRFDGVHVGDADIVGTLGGAASVLDALFARASVALSAEMLGGASEAFERTLAYLKVRKQFGVAIGSFQALKHRAAVMFCELELSRSLVRAALNAIDETSSTVNLLASAAKARLSDTFMLVANEAIQMHGGIGVTDECDIGFFLKRARACEMTFGSSSYHRDRFATLEGY